MSDWEKSLVSLEELDRSSPELWPEPMPGVTEYAARNSLTASSLPESVTTLQNAEDFKLLNFYSSLSKEALIAELRKLHDLAYKLGLDESKEMSRGRLLNILGTVKRK